MKKLILIRGVSGSGKSTFARLVYNLAYGIKYHTGEINTIMVSADDYFTDEHGFYKFNPKKLSQAHEFCQKTVGACMIKEKIEDDCIIIVHNTFTQDWEMQPYFDMAKQYEYQVTTLIMENRHKSKSMHDVPEHTIINQKERFDIKL